jgi:hypothetical protein
VYRYVLILIHLQRCLIMMRFAGIAAHDLSSLVLLQICKVTHKLGR